MGSHNAAASATVTVYMTTAYLRRSFCGLGGAALLGGLLGCATDDSTAETQAGSGGPQSSSGPPPDTDGGGPTRGGDLSSSSASSDSGATTTATTATTDTSAGSSDTTQGSTETSDQLCMQSAPDIEGPFYREGIPVRDDLDIHGDEGSPLHLFGVVRDSACKPLQNAVVELWHASPTPPGAKPGDADATYDDTGDFRYYGQTATDAEGRYSFTTLQPGWYLNGASYRPAHLHVKIWVGGAAEPELVTQLYFEGDPFNAADNWFNPDMAIAPDAQGEAPFDFGL